MAKVNEDGRAQLVEELGIDLIVSAKTATADAIMSYVRARQNSLKNVNVESMYQLVGGRVEALEFIIALVDNEAFNFGDAEFPAKFPQSELDRMEAYNFPEMLSNRKHIKEVLDSMNVKKDLKLSKCTSDDIDNLMRIVNSIGDHRIIRGEIDEKNPGQKN